jgi:hypothetical protein
MTEDMFIIRANKAVLPVQKIIDWYGRSKFHAWSVF